VNDPDQLLSRFRYSGLVLRLYDALADVVFEYLGDEAIHRAAASGCLLQHGSATCVAFQGARGYIEPGLGLLSPTKASHEPAI
jgi:hypothetical protein